MKAKVAAKDLLTAVKTVGAVHGFGQSESDTLPGLLLVRDDQLEVVSARLGACIVKRCPAKMLREGIVGVNLKDLERMKLTGDVTIDASSDKVKFSDAKAAYSWGVYAQAQKDVKEQRGSVDKIKTLAKIPTSLLRSGATLAIYRSEIKDDFTVQITIAPNHFEFAGLDYLSCGKFTSKTKGVKAKRQFHFTLGDQLLSKIVQEITADEVTIGMTKDGSMVRLSCPDFDCHHPTVDKKYMDTAKLDDAVMGNKSDRDCTFEVDQAEAKEAIERVKPVGSRKGTNAKMWIVADKGGVVLRQSAQDGAAMAKMETQNLKVKEKTNIVVRAGYFEEFIKTAPKGVPLAVSSWQHRYLRIHVAADKNTTISYLAMMIGEQSAE